MEKNRKKIGGKEIKITLSKTWCLKTGGRSTDSGDKKVKSRWEGSIQMRKIMVCLYNHGK